MAGGNTYLGHSNQNENDSNDDKGAKFGFDEAGEDPISNLPTKLLSRSFNALPATFFWDIEIYRFWDFEIYGFWDI